MLAFILLLVLIAVALGLIGAVVKGLFWLLIIGVVVFLLALVIGGLRMGRSTGRRAERRAQRHQQS